MSRVLCAIDDLPEGQGKGFEIEDSDGNEIDIFLVRKAGAVYGYFNDCPHIGTPLNWRDDAFMTMDGSMLLCATHGAVFRIEDGYCTAGPCAGLSLRPLPLVCRDGKVLIDVQSAETKAR